MNAAVSLALDKLEKSLALYVNEAFAVERDLPPSQDNPEGGEGSEGESVSGSLPCTPKVQPLYLRIAATLIGVIMWAVIFVLIAFCFPSVFGSYTENLSIYAQQLARFLTGYAP